MLNGFHQSTACSKQSHCGVVYMYDTPRYLVRHFLL